MIDQNIGLREIKWIKFTCHPKQRLPNHISIIARTINNQPVSGRQLVRELSSKGIFTSSGSACSSMKSGKSSILQAIKVDPKDLGSSLRISLGNWIENLDSQAISNILEASIEKINKENHYAK